MFASARTPSSSPSSASFRLLEPALTTRIRTRRGSARGHGPVAYVGHVVADLACVRAVAHALVDHVLAQLGRALAEPGDAVDDVDHEVEAVHVVEHDHVERRRGRALLLVAAHVETRVVRAPV